MLALSVASLIGPAGASAQTSCPNAEFRTGPSASLPDCRAYEMVTPYEMNGVTPAADTLAPGNGLVTPLVSPISDSVLFMGTNGGLPGYGGGGTNEIYRAVRTDGGWQTSFIGPTGDQVEIPGIRAVSPDHQYVWVESTFSQYNRGSFGFPESNSEWLRFPDGSWELVGEGSQDTALLAELKRIAPGGSHIVYAASTPLEPGVTGSAVYDRTPDGTKHVVSRLPSGDIAPNAAYRGSSGDGTVVAFASSLAKLYARVDNQETVTVADGFRAGGGLTCQDGSGDEVPTDFQWLRDGEPIAGATAATYKVAPADSGTRLQCRVTAGDAGAGSTQTSSNVAVSPVSADPENAFAFIQAPTEDLEAGTTLTCGVANVTDSSVEFRWYSNGEPIAGATDETYVLAADDVPSAMQCEVTTTNDAGSVVTTSFARDTTPPLDPAAPLASANLQQPATAFAGAADDGSRLFYEQGGNLWAFDVAEEQHHLIADSGDARVVNISADGSHLYFTSLSQLDGDEGAAGEHNLYVWDGADVRFVAVLTERDVLGEALTGDSGLGSWTTNTGEGMHTYKGPVLDPSRTTPDGRFIAFESRAQLTSYDNAGHVAIYRYDAVAEEIVCASCDPSGAPPAGDARLQVPPFDNPVPAVSPVRNIADDGQTVFFEHEDPLVLGDIDGVVDIYRWRAGEGGDPDVALISSGRSDKYEKLGGGFQTSNFLWGASPDGSAVYILTRDALVKGAAKGSAAIYGARIGGGFPPPTEAEAPCQGDACQNPATLAPKAGGAGTETYRGSGNLQQPLSCGRFGQRASRLSVAARRLRIAARRMSNPKRAARTRRKATGVARRAKRLKRQQAACARARRAVAK
jgi:hypothetical protein